MRIPLFEDVDLSPPLTALVILALTLGVAKVTEIVLGRFLGRLTRRTRTELDDRSIDLLRRPIFMSVLLVGLGWATLALELPLTVERITISLLKTIAILIWLGAILPLVTLFVESVQKAPDRFQWVEARTAPLFSNLFKIAAVAAGIYLLILAWNINAAAWLASAGIVGIAVGFAARDTLANVFSGIFILADAPYKIGDYVNLDTGERGEVSHIGLRSTRLITRDDIEITIPNAVMGNAKIVNETGGRWSRERVRVKVGAAYGSDVDQVRRVLEEVGRENEMVCEEPEPRARFRSFGNSGLDFELLCWIEKPELRGLVVDALNAAVYKRFAAEGIEIPFPKRDVYIKEMPGTSP